MKKNVASQVIGAQMIDSTNGAEFTNQVTVYVTINGGSQTLGATNLGLCTHEGNGYHTYVPSQAETNGDLVAFTFKGTNALTQTLQVYTDYPQTGDAYTAIPSEGNIAAAVWDEDLSTHTNSNSGGIALQGAYNNSVEIATFVEDLDGLVLSTGSVGSGNTTTQVNLSTLQYADDTINGYLLVIRDNDSVGLRRYSRWVLAWNSATKMATVSALPFTPQDLTDTFWLFALRGDLSGSVGGVTGLDTSKIDVAISSRASQTSVDTIIGYIDTEIAAIKAKTDSLPTDPADASDIAAAIAALNDLSTSDVRTQVAAALTTDTYGEPSTSPAATASLATKIGHIYMALRNKFTVTSSAKTFYNDSGGPVWAKNLADDGTTYTENEGA
jgi:hypothetical protein